MTAIDFGSSRVARPGRPARQDSTAAGGIAVVETYSGYVIHTFERAPVAVVIAQTACWIGGIVAVLGAIGLGATAQVFTEGGAMRWAAIGAMTCAAILLFWFASRGATSELHVDTRQGEVREITRNRAGRPSLNGRHGFDSIGSVFIDRGAERGRSGGEGVLLIRLGNTAQVLRVAKAEIAELEPLRDRLGRDLVIRSHGTAAPIRLARPRQAGALAQV